MVRMLLTFPLKMERHEPCASVAISMPLFSMFTPAKTGCLCFPNLEITRPLETGQGKLPLFELKLLESFIASGVDAKCFTEVEFAAFLSSSAMIRSISCCIFFL